MVNMNIQVSDSWKCRGPPDGLIKEGFIDRMQLRVAGLRRLSWRLAHFQQPLVSSSHQLLYGQCLCLSCTR